MHGNAIPVVDPSESLRRLDETSSSPLNREQVKLVQTPQVFSVREIIKAYKKPWQKSFTDDATVAEANGIKIHLVEGDHMNIKITHHQDLVLAETILASRQKNQTKMR
jgi:2-C-methyl-D-erythritol 4-phosphate cytidylyltransferase